MREPRLEQTPAQKEKKIHTQTQKAAHYTDVLIKRNSGFVIAVGHTCLVPSNYGQRIMSSH